MPDVPHADCAWHVPPPPWQQTAGALQSADDAHDPDPPLELELPPLELPPQRAGKSVHSVEPLLELELDPLLPAPDDDELDELVVVEQTPAWQVPPVVVQSEHALPAVPHVLSS